ncbi:hypothetical protein C5B85_03335 [Pseudoclavibacter sp. AY1F1]|uniref:helix-turn-helix transcriptional regulator n=1 Tax=Pseudoclavibacter sp. AY1F1 TaxID=2080583 RepID=UPI000CE74F93|nr:hypothetical protein C5B85_03335 [Pseudoclavibacter sp. AY1F1]
MPLCGSPERESGSPFDSTERAPLHPRDRIDMNGTAAVDWMREQGWHVTHVDQSVLIRVVCERITTPSLVLGRVWSTPMSLQIVPIRTEQELSYVSLPLTGKRSLSIEGTTHALEAPSLFVHPVATPFELHAADSGALLFLGLPSSRVDPWLPQGTQARPLSGAAVYRETLLSAVMAVLSADAPLESPGFGLAASGLQQLALAVLQSAVSQASGKQPPAGAAAAIERIKRKAHDRAYSVARLAHDLDVSTAHLHRLFKPSGSTPGRLLRSERLHIAQELLIGGHANTLELELIADQSGFSSARSLQRALSAQALESLTPPPGL